MKIKPLKTLRMPKKPSDGLRACIKDLEMVEKDNRYIVDMQSWHTPRMPPLSPRERCEVCLGGARMARYYNNPKINRIDISDCLSFKIHAMDFK